MPSLKSRHVGISALLMAGSLGLAACGGGEAPPPAAAPAAPPTYCQSITAMAGTGATDPTAVSNYFLEAARAVDGDFQEWLASIAFVYNPAANATQAAERRAFVESRPDYFARVLQECGVDLKPAANSAPPPSGETPAAPETPAETPAEPAPPAE